MPNERISTGAPGRGPSTFRQRDVERALRAMRRAGFDGKVEIDPRTGKIAILPGDSPETVAVEVNEWDGVDAAF